MSIITPHINTIVKLSPYSSIAWRRIGCNQQFQFRSFGASTVLRSPSTIDTDTGSGFDEFCIPDVNTFADVIEAYDNYRFLIDLPGMDKKDINLTLNGYVETAWHLR